MIAQLAGTVTYAGIDEVILLVGGIGWRVVVAPPFAQELHVGLDATIHTSMVVREDSMTLYGFRDTDERIIFEKLQSVSGIGPRTALAALTVLSPDDLRRAVSSGDTATLQKIPGVGKKSAQRMLLEIGDKLGTVAALPEGAISETAPTEDEMQVRAALVQLGWSESVAAQTVEKFAGHGMSVSDMLRAALLSLGGNRGH
ncbi:Holliday junction branch migration protein RuvA [Schaalia sp. lx-100]|uniref:Holliday junction branch migration protein RuvA n=1 Tax=Schaalia sp. lx-100 TaxID=2899081 RepID=UPI001E43225F|nr:Holliday junction branch migration protein RuvA [Schaalia sp. lx-100]MCD4557382.1 Holliday junction branch migration protein RuvA [Schaalia sp. lx-100]